MDLDHRIPSHRRLHRVYLYGDIHPQRHTTFAIGSRHRIQSHRKDPAAGRERTAFTENEHVHMQLIIAYFERKEYEKLLPLARKIYTIPQFARSRAHLRYAIALEYTGQVERAEQEFRKMKGRFSYFEPRYEYGLFLQRAGRTEEARHIFAEIAEESRHLSPRERRSNREWIVQAREEMKK
jgi:hypothetical protein